MFSKNMFPFLEQKIAAGVSMLCHPDWPCPVVQKFEAKVAIIGTEMPIVAGQPVSPASLTSPPATLTLTCSTSAMGRK
jgi:hypothetical protein